jgi:hypothetical protein
VDAVVANARGAALLAVAGDAVTDFAKAGELLLLRRSLRLDVDMDQVSGMLPLVALDWMFGLEIPQPPQTKAVENPGHGGERCCQKPRDVAEVQPLMPQLYGLLQMPWIERPPPSAANTTSIHQSRCTA